MMKVLTAALLCMVIGLFSSMADAADTPEGVLAELEAIYAAGDAAGYAALLADDYELVSKTGDGWGKREDLAGTGKLFTTARATLTFTRDFAVHPGDKPDTWVLERVPATLGVVRNSDTMTVRSVITLSVRKDPETGAVRIFRWVESAP
jgi:hypothetical protein